MKRVKKVLALILALAMVLAVLPSVTFATGISDPSKSSEEIGSEVKVTVNYEVYYLNDDEEGVVGSGGSATWGNVVASLVGPSTKTEGSNTFYELTVGETAKINVSGTCGEDDEILITDYKTNKQGDWRFSCVENSWDPNQNAIPFKIVEVDGDAYISALSEGEGSFKLLGGDIDEGFGTNGVNIRVVAPAPEPTPVAQIGETQYETLADAVANVPAGLESSTTIKVIADVAVDGTIDIPKTKNITIDLNGHVVSCSISMGNSPLISNRGILTIKDSKDVNRNGEGGGKLTSIALNPDMQPIPGYATNTITNYGKLTVESGWINSGSDGKASYAIDNEAQDAQWQQCYGVDNSEVVLYVSGGKITSGQSVSIRMYLRQDGKCDNIISITGGTIGSLWIQEYEETAKGSLTISNATITNDLYLGWYGLTKNLQVNVTNNVLRNVEVDANYATQTPGTHSIEFTGNKVKSFTSSKELRILTDGYYGSVVAEYVADGYCCIDNTDENKATYPYKVVSSSVVAEGVTVYTTPSAKFSYYWDEESHENPNSYTISTIFAQNWLCPDEYLDLNADGAMYEDAVLAGTTPLATNGNATLYMNFNNYDFIYGDCRIKIPVGVSIATDKAMDGLFAVLGEGRIVKTTINETSTLNNKTYSYLYTAAPAIKVAEVDGVQYETVEAAIAAAANGATVKLLCDASLTEEVTDLELNKSITLDLAGYTLTATRINLKKGGLNVITSVAGGKVTSAGQTINVYGSEQDVANYTTLTIGQGVKVEGKYAICLFPVNNTNKVSYGATININGTLTGTNGTVFVSGNLGDAETPGAALAASDNIPVINVGSKAVITSSGDQAIAMNGMAKVVVSEGASVTGREAIGLKRGILIVNGGTFTADGAKKDPAEANMNGTEATGAALSITSTYNYAGMISATINGGTFTSTNNTAVYVGHAKKDSSVVAYNKGVTLAIKDGAFEGAADSGAIYVASAISGETIPYGFITGGTFSSEPAADYIALGYEAKENAGKWTVVQKENVTVTVEETSGDDTTATVAIGGQSVATVEVKIAPAATVAAVEKATAATVKTVEEAVNVSKVVEKAMDNGTIVAQQNTIELLVKADDTPVAVPNVTVEQGAAVFKVDPYAIVNGDTENPIKLTNDDLATNSTGFTFTLSLGTSFAGKTVTLKHYSDAGKLQKTWADTADANGDVTITLTSFSYIVGEEASVSAECAGYLASTDADIRASLLWNVFFYIDTGVIENPLNAKIVVSSAYDSEIDGKQYSLTKDGDYYKITVPIRHRLIDQDVGFTLVYNNTAYNMKLGASGQVYLSVPYSFNAYLTVIAAANPEYAGIIEAMRAYRDALLAKWPVNN